MTPPLVTVVVPAYNATWSLDETLASVCAQTYPNLEVLVVDDGSTDATAELATAWSRRDARVRLISKPNGGVASARNRAGCRVAPVGKCSRQAGTPRVARQQGPRLTPWKYWHGRSLMPLDAAARHAVGPMASGATLKDSSSHTAY